MRSPRSRTSLFRVRADRALRRARQATVPASTALLLCAVGTIPDVTAWFSSRPSGIQGLGWLGYCLLATSLAALVAITDKKISRLIGINLD